MTVQIVSFAFLFVHAKAWGPQGQIGWRETTSTTTPLLVSYLGAHEMLDNNIEEPVEVWWKFLGWGTVGTQILEPGERKTQAFPFYPYPYHPDPVFDPEMWHEVCARPTVLPSYFCIEKFLPVKGKRKVYKVSNIIRLGTLVDPEAAPTFAPPMEEDVADTADSINTRGKGQKKVKRRRGLYGKAAKIREQRILEIEEQERRDKEANWLDRSPFEPETKRKKEIKGMQAEIPAEEDSEEDFDEGEGDSDEEEGNKGRKRKGGKPRKAEKGVRKKGKGDWKGKGGKKLKGKGGKEKVTYKRKNMGNDDSSLGEEELKGNHVEYCIQGLFGFVSFMIPSIALKNFFGVQKPSWRFEGPLMHA